MSNVKLNLHKPLGDLEMREHTRYSPGDISIAVGGRVSRQTIHAILTKESKSVTMDTLAALIDFFKGRGVNVTFDDLFEYTPDSSSTPD